MRFQNETRLAFENTGLLFSRYRVIVEVVTGRDLNCRTQKSLTFFFLYNFWAQKDRKGVRKFSFFGGYNSAVLGYRTVYVIGVQ
jgi:hypothetical protein